MARPLHPAHLCRPWVVWWAVLLAVLFATAPTLSHALAFASGDSRFAICTAQGPWTVAADSTDSGDSPSGQESAATLQHCPFCLHPTDRIAPPPSLLPYLMMVAGGQQEVPVWQAFFFRHIHARWLEPRGPPTA
jgi:hypothetical protein